jgi:hypothetical protein
VAAKRSEGVLGRETEIADFLEKFPDRH